MGDKQLTLPTSALQTRKGVQIYNNNRQPNNNQEEEAEEEAPHVIYSIVDVLAAFLFYLSHTLYIMAGYNRVAKNSRKKKLVPIQGITDTTFEPNTKRNEDKRLLMLVGSRHQQYKRLLRLVDSNESEQLSNEPHYKKYKSCIMFPTTVANYSSNFDKDTLIPTCSSNSDRDVVRNNADFNNSIISNSTTHDDDDNNGNEILSAMMIPLLPSTGSFKSMAISNHHEVDSLNTNDDNDNNKVFSNQNEDVVDEDDNDDYKSYLLNEVAEVDVSRRSFQRSTNVTTAIDPIINATYTSPRSVEALPSLDIIGQPSFTTTSTITTTITIILYHNSDPAFIKRFE